MKEQKQNLTDVVTKEANSVFNLIVVYATPAGYRFAAPVSLFESLIKLGKGDEARLLASQCFSELLKQGQFDEASKCRKYFKGGG